MLKRGRAADESVSPQSGISSFDDKGEPRPAKSADLGNAGPGSVVALSYRCSFGTLLSVLQGEAAPSRSCANSEQRIVEGLQSLFATRYSLLAVRYSPLLDSTCMAIPLEPKFHAESAELQAGTSPAIAVFRLQSLISSFVGGL